MNRILNVVLVLLLAGCATTYQRSGFTGGFSDRHLEGNIYRVVFSGNGHTTRETVQTYWLFRCADLALEREFDGFEILSDIQLVHHLTPDQLSESLNPVKNAYVVVVPAGDMYKPSIQADIKLLKKPFEHKPPKFFDAKILINSLEPFINGEKCDKGNVCPHAHKYVYPNQTDL